MGEQKNKILVAVVVVLFVASGLVLYNGFAGEGSVTGAVPDIATTQKEITNLLPYGEKVNFDRVREYAQESRPFNIDPLDPATVGAPLTALFVPGGDKTGVVSQQPGGSSLENPIPRRSQ